MSRRFSPMIEENGGPDPDRAGCHPHAARRYGRCSPSSLGRHSSPCVRWSRGAPATRRRTPIARAGRPTLPLPDFGWESRRAHPAVKPRPSNDPVRTVTWGEGEGGLFARSRVPGCIIRGDCRLQHFWGTRLQRHERGILQCTRGDMLQTIERIESGVQPPAPPVNRRCSQARTRGMAASKMRS